MAGGVNDGGVMGLDYLLRGKCFHNAQLVKAPPVDGTHQDRLGFLSSRRDSLALVRSCRLKSSMTSDHFGAVKDSSGFFETPSSPEGFFWILWDSLGWIFQSSLATLGSFYASVTDYGSLKRLRNLQDSSGFLASVAGINTQQRDLFGILRDLFFLKYC